MESYSETIEIITNKGMHASNSIGLTQYMNGWLSDDVEITIQNPETGNTYGSLDAPIIGHTFNKGMNVKIIACGDLEKKELELIVKSAEGFFTKDTKRETLKENVEKYGHSGFQII